MSLSGLPTETTPGVLSGWLPTMPIILLHDTCPEAPHGLRLPQHVKSGSNLGNCCTGNRPDVPVLLPGHKGLMRATVSDTRAFGFLDGGESVLWGAVPVLKEAVSTVSPGCALTWQKMPRAA